MLEVLDLNPSGWRGIQLKTCQASHADRFTVNREQLKWKHVHHCVEQASDHLHPDKNLLHFLDCNFGEKMKLCCSSTMNLHTALSFARTNSTPQESRFGGLFPSSQLIAAKSRHLSRDKSLFRTLSDHGGIAWPIRSVQPRSPWQHEFCCQLKGFTK